jgi:hypothetical protein
LACVAAPAGAQSTKAAASTATVVRTIDPTGLRLVDVLFGTSKERKE